MKPTATLLAVVCVFLFASLSLSLGGKAEALAEIDSLIESGHLDEAKKLLDHLMAHNAGDPDLKRLNEKWKVHQGDLGLLRTDLDLTKPENRKVLREACFTVVRATMGGNPEEWAPLLLAGDADEVRLILTERTTIGSSEPRQTAKDLLDPPAVTEPTDEELIAAVKSGPDSCRDALDRAARWQKKSLKPFAKQIFAAKTTMDLRIAAAGLLLALGDGTKRAFLIEALETDRPIDAVCAARLLAADSGSDLVELFRATEASDDILRAKPQILAEFIAGLGNRREDDGAAARKFLTALLTSPRHHIDAARALGARHDAAAVPALLEYLRKPRPEDDEDDATAGGLGYLGGGDAPHSEVRQAEELRPILVGAIAILRATAP